MNEAQPNTALSIKFLQDYRPGGPWILTAIGVDRQFIKTKTFTPENEAELAAWVEECNKGTRNVYFHVNPATGKLDKKAEKTDMAAMEWLHVDVDPEPGMDFRREQERILKMLQKNNALPKPTLIIFSGGGYQAFWKLDQPIPIDGNEAKAEDAELYNLQIELLVNGDSCHNVDRIMRLPGTVNWPNEKKRKRGQTPVMAEVVLWEPDRVFPLSTFTKAPKRDADGSLGQGSNIPVNVPGNVRRVTDLSAELPAGVSERCKVVINQGLDTEQPLKGDNSRSEWLHYVCCELVRHDTPDEMIYGIITDPEWAISASVLDKGNSAQIDRYAKRQIQRAKESNIDPWLEHLNRRYALVQSVGGRLRIAWETKDPADDRPVIEFLLVEGFTKAWCNQFVDITVQGPKGSTIKQIPVGKWWIEHPNRRTYDTVTFYPGRDTPGVLNLWRGFAYDAIPGDCSLFLDHIKNVLCRGNQEWYDYLIRWMANAVQNPHLPGQVAVVMRGGQGTGKGTFANHFGKLFGTHYKTTSNIDDILGNFNIMLHDAAVVFADEAFASGNPKHEAALKALITENKIRVTPKGVDSMETRNCGHLLMATNSEWAINASWDDRRFFVLNMDDSRRVDTDYFAAIAEQMENGGYQALLHHLLTMDLSGFNVRNCPKTDELRNQQDHSMSPFEAFWFNILTDGALQPRHGRWTGQALKAELVDAFTSEYDVRRLRNVKMALGKFLRDVARAESSRIRGKTVAWQPLKGGERTESNPWQWTFPSLQECRKLWDERFGAREWPAIVEDDDGPDDDTEDPNAF